ncbi:alpha/beta fold hydrolase [Flavobacterium pedocola]
MRLRNEGQKRDPKIGKKYIILIYQGIQRAIQIPLSPQRKTETKVSVFLFPAVSKACFCKRIEIKKKRNYMNSLEKVFEACENDPNCNKQFPNLENVYYETIDKLSKNPITVEVDKKIIPNGSFTYNAEDFKIAIQQALYNRKLIQVLPLLITEFNKGNKNTLSSFVKAFSGALGLDYGLYYCMSCNEAVPFNSEAKFNENALKYSRLKGGLSFFKSDFKVCDKWNLNSNQNKIKDGLSNLSKLNIPVLVFSGEFDPITPAANGLVVSKIFKNSYYLNAPVSGHVPSFTKAGMDIIAEFISNPNQKPDFKEIVSKNKVNFITDAKTNGGISNFANSLSEFSPLFFSSLSIALLILLITLLLQLCAF